MALSLIPKAKGGVQVLVCKDLDPDHVIQVGRDLDRGTLHLFFRLSRGGKTIGLWRMTDDGLWLEVSSATEQSPKSAHVSAVDPEAG